MKLTLLFIPLLFLSSCTIDWNGEKDTKIKEFEEQIQYLKNENTALLTENSNLVESNKSLTYSGNLCSAQLNKCDGAIKVSLEGSKDFGSGFTLSQTDDETTLSYSGKVIKSWSHTPPKEVPFVWDEACYRVFQGFEKLSPEELSSTGKQQVWDGLTEKEKKDCIAQKINDSLRIEYLDKDYINIMTYSYEGGRGDFFDIKNKKILFPMEGGIAQKIEKRGDILHVLVAGIYNDNLYIRYDSKNMKLIDSKIIKDDAEYIKLLNQ